VQADDARPYRVHGQFDAILNAELVEDIVEVTFDGLLADEQLLPDVRVA
jgi:hypothetical protein